MNDTNNGTQPKLFDTRAECEAFLAANNILAWPHESHRLGTWGKFIAVTSTKEGMVAVIDEARGVVLADW